MKKVIVGAVVLLAMLSISSCKKEHTCTCVDGDDTEITTIEASKSRAKTVCEGKGIESVTVDGEKLEEFADGCTLD